MTRPRGAVNECGLRGPGLATTFRWLLRVLIGFAVLAAAALAVAWLFLSRSLTDPSAQYALPGARGTIEVVRDVSAVPHVFAGSDWDVYYGLGVAHAQDRLWQMTTLRRTAQGRLSELFGARTLRTDELMRRLDLAGAARASLAAQDPATTEMLEAYSAGVNAWIGQVAEGALGRGAPEFFLFEPRIEPWSPADSLAVLKLLALQMSGHMETEILLERLRRMLGADRAVQLMPPDPGPPVAALPDQAALAAPARWAAAPRPDDPFFPVAPRGRAGASNAWAAAPERSAAGGSLLASDPHLEFSAPSIWYLARLELAAGGVIGATIPGIPLVLMGRRADLGWGLTSSYLDDQDILIERLDPEDPARYRAGERFVPFRTRQSIVEVADAAPVTLDLRWTRNGPVLPDWHLGVGAVTPPGHVAALAWTALSREDASMSAARRIMEAGSTEEALAAAEDYVAPSVNLVVADRDGVAMKTIGAMPGRDPRHASEGRVPTPGWDEENRWRGRLPYADNPEFVDPEGGIVGNTNNRAVDRPFPRHVSHRYGDTQRVLRWGRLMRSREVHTRESFVEAQLDIVSPAARSLLPLVGRELWFTSEAAPAGTPEAQRRRALDLLAEWNGEMSEHRPEPLIYSAWMRALQRRLIRDEIGPLAAEFAHPDPLFIEAVFRGTDGAGAWCDVVQSAPEETCADVARMALDDALVWIGAEWGEALESLRWGDAHVAAHDHQVLGDVWLARWLVNIRQSTSGGDHTLMRGRTIGDGPEPFRNVHGAGYRGVYDFADPDSSVFVIAGGQSGHPLSRHYDDLGELWRRGEYIPMTLDPELARAGAEGIVTIVPAGTAAN